MSAPTTTTPTTTPPTPPRATAPGRPARPSTPRLALMVAEREVVTQVRTKSFIISTAILFAAVLVSIVAGALLAGSDDPTKVAVVGTAADVVADMDGLEPVDAADRAAAEQLVRDGDVSAAVVPDEENVLGFRLLALDSAPEEVVAALSVSPEVELLDEPDTDEGLRYLVSFGFGLVFLMSAAGYGATIAQSTVQEKQSRVVEILLSAVPSRALLAGKILGNSALAFGQTAGLAAMAVIGLVVTGQEDVLDMLGAPLVWFVGFFLIGFVLLAAMYAASASLVSRVEDVGSVVMPSTMLTMVPYFGVIFFNDNEVVLNVLSYVPFSAPVAMPMRLFLGDAMWWEPLVALALLVVTTLGVIAVGAKIYERSLLRTGARVKLGEVLRQA
ncbi:ABC transporter permease [Actinotalea fermentans]|uniref:ABC transporter permease n=1 Tax=Actinotalea fermentans TaxID=43671 RepID=A0A511Z166_9CELL|nr:sodium ABC transporter permease [Actinotalea fermentans ATCC 43279 = JCM 9966 = DSM 3133]GEN81195.1 ABC transporter permease [Actinotalea fermentans]